MKEIDTSVRKYTDRELIFLMKKANGFKEFPIGYFLCGVRSKEDKFNVYDDKMYLCEYNGNVVRFLFVTSCTTNSGSEGLKNFFEFSKKGVAVLKSDNWYYNFWTYGLHKGRMPALKQVSNAIVYRDSNKDLKNDETGSFEIGIFGINFHTVTYNKSRGFISKLVGGWGVGCQVCNIYDDYEFILNKIKHQERISYVLLKED